jgi:hypothetical protein
MKAKDITDAWATIRKTNSTIPSDVLDFMKNAAIEKLNSMNSKEKEFTLFWLDGKREVVKGKDIKDAVTTAGYGMGALGALDFHSAGDNNDYVWNAVTRQWDMTEEAQKRIFKK